MSDGDPGELEFGQQEIEFSEPDRRLGRGDRRGGADRRRDLPDTRLIRRERRRTADRRTGADRRAARAARAARARAAIVLDAPQTGPAGAEEAVKTVPVRPRSNGAPTSTRAKVVAAAVVLAIVIAAGAASLLVGAATPPGPPEGAAELVPADALAYLNVSTDPRRAADQRTLKAAERLPDYPLLSAAVTTRLSGILTGGRSADIAGRIRPWLGNEAALALLDTSSATADSLTVLDVARPDRARAFLAAEGATAAGSYHGTAVLKYPIGTELAFVSHFLVLGQPGSVQAAIDVAAGRTVALAAAGPFARASAGEPAARSADLYMSADGVRRLLVAQHGLIGVAGALIDSPALQAASITISGTAAGAQVHIHRVLDPNLVRVGGRPRAAYTPTLPAAVPSGSLALVDLQGLDKLLPKLLGGGGSGGLSGRLTSLLAQLGSALAAEGIDTRQITSLFDGETATALVAGPSPSLLILARTSDPAQARDELAALEAPLAQLFPPPSSGPGRAAVFNDVNVGGVTAHQLQLTPGLEFDYAVFRGLIAVSTSLAGIRAAVGHTGSPTADGAYRAATGQRPGRVTSLIYLDLSQLLTLGERTGLTRGGQLQTLQADLAKVHTVGLTSKGGEAETTAELSLQIS